MSVSDLTVLVKMLQSHQIPMKSQEDSACRIPLTYSSEVGIISKLENSLGNYSFIPDKTNTFALNSID